MVARVLERSSESSDQAAEQAVDLARILDSAASAPPVITAKERLLADASLLVTTILWGANIPS